MSFALIPQELLPHIFSYMNPSEALTCSCVCTKWNSDTVWEQLSKHTINDDNITWREIAKIVLLERDPPLQNIKQYITLLYKQFPQSNDAIALRSLEFVSKFSKGHSARFTCIIGAGENYQTLSIFMSDRRIEPHGLNQKADYFAPQGILDEGMLEKQTVEHLKKDDGSPLYPSLFSAISEHFVIRRIGYWSHRYSSQYSPYHARILYPSSLDGGDLYQKLEDYILWIVRDRLNLLSKEHTAENHIRTRKIRHL